MLNLNRIKDRLRGQNLRIVFSNGNNERLPRIVRLLIEEALIRPIVVVDSRTCPSVLGRYGHEVELVDCSKQEAALKYAQILIAKNSSLDLEKILHDFNNPNEAAAIVLAAELADAATIQSNEEQLAESGYYLSGQIGFTDNSQLFSSFLLVEFNNEIVQECFLISDCLIDSSRDAKQLAAVAITSAMSRKKIFEQESKVALWSFTNPNKQENATIKKIVQAEQIAKIQANNLTINQQKGFNQILIFKQNQKPASDEKTRERANVLIFPNFETGNISCQILEQLTDSVFYGPFLQGLAKPVVFLQPEITSETLLNTILVLAVLALD